MRPVNLNEFLVSHPALLRLRLQVDEAAIAVKHAHVEGLRALSDKNAPLISRWHKYFQECNHGHQIFIGAFYREMTSLLNLRLDSCDGTNISKAVVPVTSYFWRRFAGISSNCRRA